MTFGITIIVVFLFLTVILFTFKKLSPIPYYPSNRNDLPLIIKALKLTNNQTVIDLGAGDGLVIFEAAKKAHQQRLNTKFIAVEINPILILVLHIKQLSNPNRRNVLIVWTDLFKFQIKNQSSIPIKMGLKIRHTIYFYGTPWLVEKIVKIIKKQLSNVRFVSYFYPIKSLKKIQTLQKNVNSVFSYQV